MRTQKVLFFLALLVSGTFLNAQLPGFELSGYAAVEGDGYATTTGGEGGDTVVVTHLSELEAFAGEREKVFTPVVLILNGYFEAAPSKTITFKHGANLSILGGGEGAELKGVGIRIWDYHNVIVRNLKIHEVFYPDDALSVEECHHVWVDHNELHSQMGPGIGVDTYDGLLDIKKGSRFVTVSWNYLHDHMKCMLIGHTDNATQGEEDQAIRVTIHHNIFENTDGRNPSLRWGAAHIYNNLYSNIADYAIALRQGAHGLVENNLFHNVNLAVSTNKFDGEGFACMSGNTYSGTTLESKNSITQTGCDFWDSLPYDYTPDSTQNLEALLRDNTGVGILNDVNPNSVEQVTTFEPFNVFPNPTSGEFFVSFSTEKNAHYTIAVYNLHGEKLFSENVRSHFTGQNQVFVNMKSFQQGIYIISLSTSQGVKTKRIMISNLQKIIGFS
ncbi:MAG TPA: T9SS type A sorting domain-containing protein [Prolixibacteraceae bacterium]|nr:T9SS type A sorting domain-containing protein [Prolixibacteraceae bacterium]